MVDIVKKEITWVNLSQPKEGELKWLKEKYRIHPVILDELRGPSARSHVEAYKNYLYLVYQFPIYDASEKVSRRNEIDFVVTKKEVITVQYEHLEFLDGHKESLRGVKMKDETFQNTLRFVYAFILSIIHFEQRQLRHIGEKIEDIGSHLFKNKEKEVLQKISYLKRDLSEYRIIVRPQAHILQSLLDNAKNFWGDESQVFLNDLIGEHLKLLNAVEDYRLALEDYEATNVQMMSVKTGETMKLFTIMAFSTFPVMVLIALLSMGANATPIVNEAGGFWIIFGVVVTALICMYALFKRKGWLE